MTDPLRPRLTALVAHWRRWKRRRYLRWAMQQYRAGHRAPLLAIVERVPHVNKALFDRIASEAPDA